jgi:hypothetical protein
MLARERPPLPYPVNPDLAIWIDHYLDDFSVGQRPSDDRAHGLAKGCDLSI